MGVWNDIKMQYGNYKWVNVITDPISTTILTEEMDYLSKRMDVWLKLGNEEHKF
jgi:hypothetical protein